MGGVPKKHHSKSKVGRRRSQLALKRKRVLACPKCSGPTMPHRVCSSCGFYGTEKKKGAPQVSEVKQKEVEQKKESEEVAEEEVKEVSKAEERPEEVTEAKEEETAETTEEPKKEKS